MYTGRVLLQARQEYVETVPVDDLSGLDHTERRFAGRLKPAARIRGSDGSRDAVSLS